MAFTLSASSCSPSPFLRASVFRFRAAPFILSTTGFASERIMSIWRPTLWASVGASYECTRVTPSTSAPSQPRPSWSSRLPQAAFTASFLPIFRLSAASLMSLQSWMLSWSTVLPSPEATGPSSTLVIIFLRRSVRMGTPICPQAEQSAFVGWEVTPSPSSFMPTSACAACSHRTVMGC